MNMRSAIVSPPHPARAGAPLARALSLGDLDSASACFLRDGCLITPDATAIHGRDRIRPVLAQLVARRTEIEVELSTVVGGGDAALARERWRTRSGGSEAPQVEQTWNPILVLRRTDESWKLAVAAPWGWGQARL